MKYEFSDQFKEEIEKYAKVLREIQEDMESVIGSEYEKILEIYGDNLEDEDHTNDDTEDKLRILSDMNYYSGDLMDIADSINIISRRLAK